MKYESEGGPGFADCSHFIRTYCSVPATHLMRLFHWAVFNLCIGNMDAHAKNLSILTSNSRKVLAPFYDLICTLYYEGFSSDLAMSIGGRINPDRIGFNQWKNFAQEIGLPEKIIMQEIPKIIRKIIDKLPETAAEAGVIVPQRAFVEDLRQFILNRCIHLLRKLR